MIMGEKKTKARDWLFDNYKALLIVLVVTGHLTEPCYENNGFLYVLKWLIFTFHMPAFILISGYFSRRSHSLKELAQKFLVPYLVFEVIYYLVYTVIIQKETSLALLFPKFSLWYLPALFVWRAVTPYVKKVPHYFLLSVLGGLAAGFFPGPSNFLTLPRILFFYPYFLAGTLLDRNLLTRLREKATVRRTAALGTVLYVLFLIFDPVHTLVSPKVFYGRYSYDYLGMEPMEGMLVRLLCYGAGFFLTWAGLILISGRRHWFSFLGSDTLPIYLFHGLIYKIISGRTDLLSSVETLPESFALLAFCLVLTLALSTPALGRFTAAVSNLSLSHMWQEIRPQLSNRNLLPGASSQRFRYRES